MVRRGLAMSLALLGVHSSCAAAPPPEKTVAHGVLAGFATKEAVSTFIPQVVPACHATAPDLEVCTWRLGNSQHRWKDLAGMVPTRERIHLVCFFPLTGDRRSPDSCTVFASVRRLDGTPSSRDRNGPEWEQFRAAQKLRLDAAKTIVEMSMLMGSGPDLCVLLGPERRRCQWRAGYRNPGYLVLRAILDTRQRIRLTCTFPTDGSARQPVLSSCYRVKARFLAIRRRRAVRRREPPRSRAWLGDFSLRGRARMS